MANENVKQDAIDELDGLLDQAGETTVSNDSVDDLLDGVGMGEKTHIMTEGGESVGSEDGEAAGSTDSEYLPKELQTELQSKAEGKDLSQAYLTLRSQVQAASKVVGYVVKDDEQQEFSKRTTVRKDGSGNKVLKPEYTQLAGKTQAELTKAGYKASEIYEYEVDVLPRSKAPSGFQGALVSLPLEAYQALATKTEMESATIGATSVLGFPRTAFVTVVGAVGGQLKEAQEIVKDYIVDKKKPPTGENVVKADSEENTLVLVQTSRLVAVLDEDGNPTGEKQTVKQARVKHAKRRSLFVPGNYIPLRRFVNVTIPEKLTKEEADTFNNHYLGKFAKVAKNNSASTIDLLTADSKGKKKLWTTVDAEGNTQVKSVYFSEDANTRLKNVSIEHWYDTDKDGKPAKVNLSLPVMFPYGEKNTLRKKVDELHSTGIDGETGEKMESAYTLADPAFSAITQAAGGLDYKVIEALKVQVSKENEKTGAGRKRKAQTYLGLEAANILIQDNDIQGVAKDEVVMGIIAANL